MIKWKTDALRTITAAKNKKSSKGWDWIKIKNDAGDEVDAVAPLIISASRRNDTPAHPHHSQWFLEGLKRGYLGYVNRGVRYVSFKNANVIVFWTKDPEPIMEHLDEMDKRGIGYYFQYTLNDYDKKLEPNLPPLEERIETFKTLSEKIGKAKVIWRFDPLLLTDTITKESLVKKVGNLMKQLSGHTEKLVINFIRTKGCEHILKRFEKNNIKLRQFEPGETNFVARKIGELAKNYNLQVNACRVKEDLSRFEIGRNKCIDDNLMERLFKDDEILMSFLDRKKKLEDPFQKDGCKCIVSEDIGTNNTCANMCLYCYANKSDKAVQRNSKLIENGEIGEFLVPKNPKN